MNSKYGEDWKKEYESGLVTKQYDAALYQSRMEYERLFEKKEALMLEGINKGKQIKEIQKEMSSVVDSY